MFTQTTTSRKGVVRLLNITLKMADNLEFGEKCGAMDTNQCKFPSNLDILKAHDNLDGLLQQLVAMESPPQNKLGKSLIAKIILWNRSKAEDVSNILVEDCLKIERENIDEELLPIASREIFRLRFTDQWQESRSVLLNKSMYEALRKFMGMAERPSKYVFVSPDDLLSPFDGEEAMREAARDAGVADASLFTSTALRYALTSIPSADDYDDIYTYLENKEGVSRY